MVRVRTAQRVSTLLASTHATVKTVSLELIANDVIDFALQSHCTSVTFSELSKVATFIAYHAK